MNVSSVASIIVVNVDPSAPSVATTFPSFKSSVDWLPNEHVYCCSSTIISIWRDVQARSSPPSANDRVARSSIVPFERAPFGSLTSTLLSVPRGDSYETTRYVHATPTVSNSIVAIEAQRFHFNVPLHHRLRRRPMKRIAPNAARIMVDAMKPGVFSSSSSDVGSTPPSPTTISPNMFIEMCGSQA